MSIDISNLPEEEVLKKINETYDEHEILKLEEIACKYNNLPVMIHRPKDNCGIFSHIENRTVRPDLTIPKYSKPHKKLKYIIALWIVGINIPEILTFGKEYDWLFRTTSSYKILNNIEEDVFYQTYTNDKYYVPFLYFIFSKFSSKKIRKIKDARCSSETKEIASCLPQLDLLEEKLKNMKKVELLFIIFELSLHNCICYAYGVDYLNYIKLLQNKNI